MYSNIVLFDALKSLGSDDQGLSQHIYATSTNLEVMENSMENYGPNHVPC